MAYTMQATSPRAKYVRLARDVPIHEWTIKRFTNLPDARSSARAHAIVYRLVQVTDSTGWTVFIPESIQ